MKRTAPKPSSPKGLTPQREKFAQAVADGMSQADAYRTAFKVRPGTKAHTIQANASRLMTNSEVVTRVNELKAKLAEMALWTRADSVEVLREIARGGEKDSDRVSAVKELNAMHGLNAPQKIDHQSSDGSMSPTRIVIEAAPIPRS